MPYSFNFCGGGSEHIATYLIPESTVVAAQSKKSDTKKKVTKKKTTKKKNIKTKSVKRKSKESYIVAKADIVKQKRKAEAKQLRKEEAAYKKELTKIKNTFTSEETEKQRDKNIKLASKYAKEKNYKKATEVLQKDTCLMIGDSWMKGATAEENFGKVTYVKSYANYLQESYEGILLYDASIGSGFGTGLYPEWKYSDLLQQFAKKIPERERNAIDKIYFIGGTNDAILNKNINADNLIGDERIPQGMEEAFFCSKVFFPNASVEVLWLSSLEALRMSGRKAGESEDEYATRRWMMYVITYQQYKNVVEKYKSLGITFNGALAFATDRSGITGAWDVHPTPAGQYYIYLLIKKII